MLHPMTYIRFILSGITLSTFGDVSLPGKSHGQNFYYFQYTSMVAFVATTPYEKRTLFLN